MSKPLEFENRRDFLKKVGCGLCRDDGDGRAASCWPRTEVEHPEAKADCCILLWMAGGMAAPDTFDPKRYEPFKVGLPVKDVRSTFPAIETAVDGIKFTEGLEDIAKVMDRGTLIRSPVQPDLGHILHSRHQYHWHTGYVPPQTVAAPHIGAWMAKVSRAAQPGDARLHRHRAAARGRRREGGAEGLPHRRLLRQRVRPFPPAVSRSGDRCGAAARRG